MLAELLPRWTPGDAPNASRVAQANDEAGIVEREDELRSTRVQSSVVSRTIASLQEDACDQVTEDDEEEIHP